MPHAPHRTSTRRLAVLRRPELTTPSRLVDAHVHDRESVVDSEGIHTFPTEGQAVDQRMLASGIRDRLVDCMEEFVKVTYGFDEAAFGALGGGGGVGLVKGRREG